MKEISLSKECTEHIEEYISVMDKADSLQRAIYDELESLGIDTDSVEFQQIVGDTFAYGELESVEQLKERIEEFLNLNRQ